MEEFFFKVTPRVVTDHVNDTRIIVGIHGRITSNIQFQIPKNTTRSIFINFMLSTGTKYGSFNVDTQEFINKMIDLGMPESTAIAQVSELIAGIQYGTDAQIYEAASALAGFYGYTLAPIEEQNGDPLYAEPTPEPENPE